MEGARTARTVAAADLAVERSWCEGQAAAIANAVHHATGRWLRRLPITIEDLLFSLASSAVR
jgi:hypothetical protein